MTRDQNDAMMSCARSDAAEKTSALYRNCGISIRIVSKLRNQDPHCIETVESVSALYRNCGIKIRIVSKLRNQYPHRINDSS